MHDLIVQQIIKTCLQREKDGDHPTVEAPGPETLEFAILQLASDIEALTIKKEGTIAHLIWMADNMPDRELHPRKWDKWLGYLIGQTELLGITEPELNMKLCSADSVDAFIYVYENLLNMARKLGVTAKKREL